MNKLNFKPPNFILKNLLKGMDHAIQVAQERGKAPGLTFHPDLGSPKTCFRVPHSAVPHPVHSRESSQSDHKSVSFASAEAHLSGFVHPRPVPHDATPGAPTLKCTMIRISTSQRHLRQPDPAPFTVLYVLVRGEVLRASGWPESPNFQGFTAKYYPSTLPHALPT